jgi:hypothetical protein
MPLSLLIYMVTYAMAYWVGPSCDGADAADYAATYWQTVERRFARKKRTGRGRPRDYG